MRMRSLLLVLLLSALSTASAQDASTVDGLLATGEGLLAEGEAAAARAVLRRAHEQSPSVRSAGLLGLAELAAGDALAADLLLRGLPSNDPWVVAEQARVTDALARIDRQLAVVTLRGAPAGHVVTVEEGSASRAVGTTPVLPFRVRPGRVVVRVGELSRDVVVVAGGRVEVDLSTAVAANPFPEGQGDAVLPQPVGPHTTPATPAPNDAPSAFAGTTEGTIPDTVRDRFPRGEVVDVAGRRSAWQPFAERRTLALGLTARALVGFGQLGAAFDTESSHNHLRAALVPSLTARFALHSRFAVGARFGVAVEPAGGTASHVGSDETWFSIRTFDAWERTIGVELDAFVELLLGSIFLDVGARTRLWIAKSEQSVTYERPGQTERLIGDVTQLGFVAGLMVRPGVWLDRWQRVRVCADIAIGSQKMLELGVGLEAFLF